MHLREVVSPRVKGPDAVYVQLVEGQRNPGTGKVQTTILHTFGRKDQLDLGQIKRLVDQLIQYLDAGERPELLSNLPDRAHLGVRRDPPARWDLA